MKLKQKEAARLVADKTYEELNIPLVRSKTRLVALRDEMGARTVENCYVYDDLHRCIVLATELKSAIDSFLNSPDTMRDA